jgi:phosphatidylglycerophosphate synthase
MSDGDGRKKGVEAEREPNFLFARFERRFLPWAARRLPRWVLPDDLTALGVLAALGVCAAYQLSNQGNGWLWAASGLLVLQWVGDSLDGTLARVRGIQRPKYGYYLDHMVDAIATAAIGLGLGLSPFMLLSIGALIVVGYLILSINVYLESMAFGRFRLGYGLLGPTEIRVVLILLNTALALSLGLGFRLLELNLTIYDVIGLGIVTVMLALLTLRVFGNLRQLSEEEPSAPRR